MSYTITQNRKNTSFVLHVSGANTGNVIIAGNSIVSNVAMGNEILTGAYICQVFVGHDGGTADAGVQILRDNTLVASYDTAGYFDYSGAGMPLNVLPSGNLQIKFVGTSNAYCMIEMQKTGTLPSEYFGPQP